LAGLFLTKEAIREKDVADRLVLERAIAFLGQKMICFKVRIHYVWLCHSWLLMGVFAEKYLSLRA
jgi:hypothetical protein